MSPPSEQARWFAEEVQPHEPQLRNWLRSRYSDAREVDEVVQESYLRLFKAKQSTPINNAKAYLFATARNVALALFRRPRIFSDYRVTDSCTLRILEEGADVAEQVCKRQEVSILLEAIETLPNKCREIFILRKLQGVPQRQIAEQLGLSEQTVQVQVARGAAKCVSYFRARGIISPPNVGP
jgi:RNA polymerase sigma factor (sigma-70 family)